RGGWPRARDGARAGSVQAGSSSASVSGSSPDVISPVFRFPEPTEGERSNEQGKPLPKWGRLFPTWGGVPPLGKGPSPLGETFPHSGKASPHSKKPLPDSGGAFPTRESLSPTGERLPPSVFLLHHDLRPHACVGLRIATAAGLFAFVIAPLGQAGDGRAGGNRRGRGLREGHAPIVTRIAGAAGHADALVVAGLGEARDGRAGRHGHHSGGGRAGDDDSGAQPEQGQQTEDTGQGSTAHRRVLLWESVESRSDDPPGSGESSRMRRAELAGRRDAGAPRGAGWSGL